jgi:hypothetical protein
LKKKNWAKLSQLGKLVPLFIVVNPGFGKVCLLTREKHPKRSSSWRGEYGL